VDLYNQKWIKIFWGGGQKDWIYGVTIWPFIFYSCPKEKVTRWLRYHESYHYTMQKRWLVLPRWIAYWYYLIIDGYENHPYEKAANDYADRMMRGG